MQVAQAIASQSAKKSANRLRADALRHGGAGLWGADARSCRLIEQVALLLAEDDRVALSVYGQPHVEHRILVVWPAGLDEPPMGGFMPEYADRRPSRQRPLGPWEREAILAQTSASDLPDDRSAPVDLESVQ